MTKPSVVHSAAFGLVVCPTCGGKVPAQDECETCGGDGFIDDPTKSTDEREERK